MTLAHAGVLDASGLQNGHHSAVDPIDVGELRKRILSGFLAAWPERDIPAEAIEASLEVSVEAVPDGPMLFVRVLGARTGFGFDGSEAGAIRAADEMVMLLAENAEGDRWIAGDGWREYRPN